jgi:hypothetical protein
VASESIARIRLDRRGVGRLRVTCGDIGTTCTGSLRLVAANSRTRRATGSVLARVTLKVRRDRLVRLKLSRRAVRYVRARKRLGVTASFTAARTLPAETGTHEENVKLLAPRR